MAEVTKELAQSLGSELIRQYPQVHSVGMGGRDQKVSVWKMAADQISCPQFAPPLLDTSPLSVRKLYNRCRELLLGGQEPQLHITFSSKEKMRDFERTIMALPPESTLRQCLLSIPVRGQVTKPFTLN